MSKKREINILVDSGFNNSYLEYLNEYFKVKNVYTLKDLHNKPIKVDLLVFTGGADVNPNLYGENVGKKTSINPKRDDENREIIMYTPRNTPKLGICRGSQFLTVQAGGSLIQHVNGHLTNHDCHLAIDNNRLTTFNITSTHHQMMYPYSMNRDRYNILAWSKVHKSTTYLDGNNEEKKLDTRFLEPEIVYYKNINALAIQGHPEFESVSKETRNITYMLINKYLFNEN